MDPWQPRPTTPRPQLQGPRPTPLKIKKPSKAPKPQLPLAAETPPPPGNKPGRISAKQYSVAASEFRSLVQHLTGQETSSPVLETPTSGGFFAEEPVSPTARVAALERTRPNERDWCRGGGADDSDFSIKVAGEEEIDVIRQMRGILSPPPAKLPVISPGFFSPPPVDAGEGHRVCRISEYMSPFMSNIALLPSLDVTGLCNVQSEVETTKTRVQSCALSGLDTYQSYQYCFGSSSAHHTYNDTAKRRTGESSGVADDSDKELMYFTVLAPSDVGESEHLVISKEHAQKRFPRLDSVQEKEGLLLHFEDSNGKVWSFCYSCLSGSHSYILSKGWNGFVKQYQLAPSDLIFFLRGVGEKGKEKLFIDWSRGAGSASSPPPTFHSLALVYCGLFPPDYEFERETMLQLWMADGIFVKEPMDRIADLFFEDCLTKGYILVSRTNAMTGKVMYKLQGNSYLEPLLTLNLNSSGSHVAKIESYYDLEDCPPDVFHLSARFPSSVDSTVLGEFEKFKQLRTLLFLQSHELCFNEVPHDFFLSLTMLRTLDLSRTHLIELPSSIRNMTCLHYLNISENPLQHLPEVIDCLENLQTLKLRGCSNLCTLPNGMSKLVNLRHLDFDVLQQLHSMPEGMGALANIRTLSAFLIGEDEGCSIRQLKNMNNISGSFCISGLENVLTEEEALEASLLSKAELSKLDLRWGDLPDEGDIENHEKVLTSLEPNACLQELEISCYGGFELPKWVSYPGFWRLTSITLFKLENCLVLPSLGQLSSLKILNIINFGQLKMIDHNFYDGRDIQGYIAFPKLEKLTVQNLPSLEVWSGIGKSNFPCLNKLALKRCPKLYSLCTLSYLCALKDLEISHCSVLAFCADDEVPALVETFVIEDCPLLSERFLKNGGQGLLEVAHVPNLWIDHQEIPFGKRST